MAEVAPRCEWKTTNEHGGAVMDPILEYAPRRLDGRLSIFRWPEGNPVAYWGPGPDEQGVLCGNCASAEEATGAEFGGWEIRTSRFSLRCKACGHIFGQASANYLSYPMPGGRSGAWPNERALITFSNRRISPLEWETPTESELLADEEPRSAEFARAWARKCASLPLSEADRKLLVDAGLVTTGAEGSTFTVTPRDVVYPFLSTIPKEGIAEDDHRYDWAMDAIDLFRWLQTLVGSAQQLLEDERWDEGFAALRRLRRIQPKHFEITARLAIGLKDAGRMQESEWEWLALAEALEEAGFQYHAHCARERWLSP